MAKKITVIGGGHGTSIVLSGLKNYDYEISGVISMADNGGSTGKLRDQLGVSAVGDIRQCLGRLTDSKEISDLFSYRFPSGNLEGHSLGNLFLAAGQLMTGDLNKSIDIARSAMGVEARLIPATNADVNLKLVQSNQTIMGVHEIATTEISGSPSLSLEPDSKISEEALAAISESDLIVIAPGHFYCSILPALLVEGVAKAIKESSAPVVFVCNLTNSNLQNNGFSVLDYLSELNRLLDVEIIDKVVYNRGEIPSDRLKSNESQVSINFVKDGLKYDFIGEDILDVVEAVPNPNDKIADLRSRFRHDKNKIAEILKDIVN